MNSITKNILVNAAKAAKHNPQKTLELVARSLTDQEYDLVKSELNAGTRIDWNNVNFLF